MFEAKLGILLVSRYWRVGASSKKMQGIFPVYIALLNKHRGIVFCVASYGIREHELPSTGRSVFGRAFALV
jgi:hypothetical protein